jgi:hypothetical protein
MAISARFGRFKRTTDPGLRHGFRSGLEKATADSLKRRGQPVNFEVVKIKYVVPAIERTYTVDFELANGIMVETKGKFEPVDRAKHLFLKTQHPDLDIRFVFQRPNTPITKGSKTTYAMWCDKYGFKYATKDIPDAWLREPGPHGQAGAAGGPRTIDVAQEVKDYFTGPAFKPHAAVRGAASRASAMAGQEARASGDRVPSDHRPRRRKAPAKAS